MGVFYGNIDLLCHGSSCPYTLVLVKTCFFFGFDYNQNDFLENPVLIKNVLIREYR